MKRANHWMGALLLVLVWPGEAMAAICTSQSAGRWDQVARWDCGHVPLAADTVVIAHNNVQMRGSYTVAGLTVNAGAVLDGNNKNLTVNGAVTVNGTYNTAGGNLTTTGGGALSVNAGGTFDFNGGNAAISGNVAINGTLSSGGDAMQMTGANTTLSGTGNIVGTTIEIDATGVSVPAGANLIFDATSQIDVGANNPGSLTINGTIDGTAQAVGTRIIRVSTGGTLTVGSTGFINAPNSQLSVRNGATATNNGTITIRDIIGRNVNPLPLFTQGANSTLNVSGAVCATACTFNASAAGNTVNYTGAAQTVYTPTGSTYANLTLGGSGAKTVPTGLTVTGNFTMSGTATVAAPAALTVGGNFSVGAGNTFTPGTGTVTLNGTAAQTVSGPNPLNFNNLTVTNAASPNLTLATNVTVTGTLTGTVVLTPTCPADYTLTVGAAAPLHSCSGPDHIQITHTGNALTCTPQTVTITACADAACTVNYSGGAIVTLTPGGQAFAIGATGVNSAATVQQATVGAATLNAVSVPAATSATPTSCWNSATATASCAMAFSDSGFLITVPDHVSCLNATATIEAVETAPGTGRCVPAYQNVTRPVNLYSSYVTPITGTQVVTASTGAVSTAAPGTAHSLTFDATGKATITLSYPDAGQLALTANDTSPTTAAMTGSGSFVVAPATFAFSAIPAAPLVAGQAFNATVTAMNGCATPAATTNFDGAVTITSSNPLPALGNATAINAALSGFINGAASLNLIWGEVGTIDLNADLAGYLGSALAVSGTQAAVGRFQPAYFDTVVTPACGSFTYAGSTTPVKAGQPFTVTVTANRAGGGVTANYAGVAYAYLTTLSNAGVTTGLANNTITAASFANGVGSANVTYGMATPQTVPLTLTLRAENADTPVVSSAGHTEGTTEIRSGRANIANAHGLELHALPVPFRSEYWSGGWVLNAADGCSGDELSGGTVGVTLSAAPVSCAQDSGSPGRSGSGCAAPGPVSQRFKEGGVAGFAGDFNLWLKAPGSGNTGTVTVTGNVPAWLQYPWTGAAAINPSARATFGIYRGPQEFIDLRENY